MSDDVRLPCGCWNFCDLSCVFDDEDDLDEELLEDIENEEPFFVEGDLALELDPADYFDPRDDYDEEDIPGSRFDPDCEDNPM